MTDLAQAQQITKRLRDEQFCADDCGVVVGGELADEAASLIAALCGEMEALRAERSKLAARLSAKIKVAEKVGPLGYARGFAEGMERAARIARCHFDDRPRRDSMDYNDGYDDATRGAAAAIRQQKDKANV